MATKAASRTGRDLPGGPLRALITVGAQLARGHCRSWALHRADSIPEARLGSACCRDLLYPAVSPLAFPIMSQGAPLSGSDADFYSAVPHSTVEGPGAAPLCPL